MSYTYKISDKGHIIITNGDDTIGYNFKDKKISNLSNIENVKELILKSIINEYFIFDTNENVSDILKLNVKILFNDIELFSFRNIVIDLNNNTYMFNENITDESNYGITFENGEVNLSYSPDNEFESCNGKLMNKFNIQLNHDPQLKFTANYFLDILRDKENFPKNTKLNTKNLTNEQRFKLNIKNIEDLTNEEIIKFRDYITKIYPKIKIEINKSEKDKQIIESKYTGINPDFFTVKLTYNNHIIYKTLHRRMYYVFYIKDDKYYYDITYELPEKYGYIRCLDVFRGQVASTISNHNLDGHEPDRDVDTNYGLKRLHNVINNYTNKCIVISNEQVPNSVTLKEIAKIPVESDDIAVIAFFNWYMQDKHKKLCEILYKKSSH